MAEALYRKYRPQIFEDVVGQEQIERTIKNAIEQDKVSHAYLFCGPRGTGKTTTARLLAKALLCEKGPTPDPDGTCEDCQMIAEGVHPDVYELDAASRTGVENVREEIINRVQFAPTRGRYKVYIIDEVHMLSIAAFNALLKTLEEPPDHVVFILATTDPQKVPETIHSRCQRFDFRRISNESIVSRLGAVCVAEGVEFEGDALDLIAHHAGGGMRNALTSLEQTIAFGEGKVTLAVAERMLGGVDSGDLANIVQALGKRDAAACFNWVAEFVESGSDLAQFARELAQHVRNLYVMSLAGTDVALDVSASERRQLADELPLFGTDRLARMLQVLGDVMAELKTSTNPRLSFEIGCTRMVRPEGDLTLAALAERVEALERSGVAVASPAAAAAPVSAPHPAAAAPAAVTPAAAVAAPDPAAPAAPVPVAAPAAAPQAAPRPAAAERPAPAPAPAAPVASAASASAAPASAPSAQVAPAP
ncbi:DNA polymerase III subunit gamma/tau, partial [Eggerthella sp. AM16-19]|uniref:DNA polymerase III subunit gamma/tau n=1 Tax=Eggerthella sp. AM16-19 TaxID=2292042 RepID=UPI000E4FDF58